MGAVLPVDDLFILPNLRPVVDRARKRLVGRVEQVDRFGNLVTNLSAGVLPASFTVRVMGAEISGAPHPHFQAVPPHALLALVGSSGMLEVCARDDSAAQLLGAGRGAPVELAP